MAKDTDKKLEEKLLTPQEEIDKQIDELMSKKTELEINQAKKENKPLRITDLSRLKVVENKDGYGNMLVDAECFSIDAVYAVFNFKTKTQTQLNGMQIDSLFGLNYETRKNFAKGEFGKSYTIGNYRFTFEYLEKQV